MKLSRASGRQRRQLEAHTFCPKPDIAIRHFYVIASSTRKEHSETSPHRHRDHHQPCRPTRNRPRRRPIGQASSTGRLAASWANWARAASSSSTISAARTPGVGHVVIAVVETTRCRHDTLLLRAGSDSTQFGGIGDTCVRVTSVNDDNPTDRLRTYVGREHLETLQQATAQIRHTTPCGSVGSWR